MMSEIMMGEIMMVVGALLVICSFIGIVFGTLIYATIKAILDKEYGYAAISFGVLCLVLGILLLRIGVSLYQ
jgi:hypothetical protein